MSVWGGAAWGFDPDRILEADHIHIPSFVEVSYSLFGWLLPMYMYQFQDASSLEQIYQQHDFGFLVLVQENLRARIKYGYTDDGVRNERAELQFLFGM